MNGKGWERYENGSKYIGNFEGGIRRGAGTMTFANGWVREGIFDTWDHHHLGL